jgi:TPR repeat protein
MAGYRTALMPVARMNGAISGFAATCAPAICFALQLPGVSMKEGWRLQVAELRVAKRNEEALVLIRQAIAEGDMSARVMLAKMGDDAGLSRSEVHQLIVDVESSMDLKDIETHLQLRGAYDARIGDLPYDEKARRCFDHHLKAVELGAGPIHTLALARIYVMGALEVEPNLTEAVRWYKHAIEQGSAEAAHELQRLYRYIEKLEKKSSKTVLTQFPRRQPSSRKKKGYPDT